MINIKSLLLIIALFISTDAYVSQTISDQLFPTNNEGVTYNKIIGCFEFSNNLSFNEYLDYLESELVSNKQTIINEATSQYGHSSLYMKIVNLENDYFDQGTWSEENDPDNYFIQDERLQIVLNNYNELIINNRLITLLDECALHTMDVADFELISKKRDIVNESNYESLSLILPQTKLTYYCDKSSDEQSVQIGKNNDCCDKNDRTKIKYYQYAPDKKVKAVLWQRNIGVINYHKIGAKIKNYTLKPNGNWGRLTAETISVQYAGTVYTYLDFVECTSPQTVSWSALEENSWQANVNSGNFASTFWTKTGSIGSVHSLTNSDGTWASLTLCLTTDCEECTTYSTGTYDEPEVLTILGPQVVCDKYGEVYTPSNFLVSNSSDWNTTNNLIINSSTEDYVIVRPANSSSNGLATISVEGVTPFGTETVSRDIWVGPPVFDVSIDYQAISFGLANVSLQNNGNDIGVQGVSIDWEIISGFGTITPSNQGAVVHLFGFNPTVEVVVTVTNACGTVEDTFIITPPPSIDIQIDDSGVSLKRLVQFEDKTVNVELTDTDIKKILIYDTLGKLISSGLNNLNISSLPKGAYLIKAVLADDKVITKKFVK